MATKTEERDWLHLAPSPPGANVQRTLEFTFALDPTYFEVRTKVEAALRRLPPRQDRAPERPLEWWAGMLALMVLYPEPAPIPDRRAARAAAGGLSEAWRNLPPDVRSRVVSRLVLTLGDTSIGHQQALARALPSTFERVAQDMRALVKRGHPVDQSREQALANSLATTYWDLTGRGPSRSGSVNTPYSRLVEEVSALPGLGALGGHVRAAVDRWNKIYPLIGPKKTQ